MQPGKSGDNLQVTLNPDVPSPASADTKDVDTSINSEEVNQKPNSARQSKKSMEYKKQELLTTCINILKEPVKEPVQESDSKPALALFPCMLVKNWYSLISVQIHSYKFLNKQDNRSIVIDSSVLC